MKKRIKAVKYTLKHKGAMLKLWYKCNTKVSLTRVLLHDCDKLIMYPIFGKEFTSKFHKNKSRHHNYKNFNDFAESYLDYASARYTKPDKPLHALDTFKAVTPEYLELAEEFFKEVKYY